jgi:hypothetical protein
MDDSQTCPYETRLNIEFQPLELIDEKALADACRYKWYNQALCQVNGSVVRLGVVQGEFDWLDVPRANRCTVPAPPSER